MNDDVVLAERIDLLTNNLIDAQIYLKDSIERAHAAVNEVLAARDAHRDAYERLRDELARISSSDEPPQ